MQRLMTIQKIFIDEKVKDVFISFGECFKYTRKKLYSKIGEEKMLENLPNRFIISLTKLDEEDNLLSYLKKSKKEKL